MKTILFDLDGTLLSMDMEAFEKIYFKEVMKIFPERPAIITELMDSTKVMIMNTEERTNESVFIEDFHRRTGMIPESFMPVFEAMYASGFDNLQQALVKENPLTKTVRTLKAKGYRIVLATNPLFPRIALDKRIRWAGFEPSDFDYMTTFEESFYLKPHLAYYQSILDQIGETAEHCLMVGNDVHEDLIAGKLGIETYLITDHMLNRHNLPIVCDHSGSYDDFITFAESLHSVL
jgi:FMN phosphatase YigB (HAD superfamily)